MTLKQRKRIAILGSTGSIGTQTLAVIESQSEHFEVEVLSAYNNVDLLIAQARKFDPNVVVIGNEDHYARLKAALADLPVKVFAGENALCSAVEMDTIDLVVAARPGRMWRGQAGGLEVAAAVDGPDLDQVPSRDAVGQG